ncbi:MAG: polyhydroxyalkanoate depolymerase, partial [Gammaproteobacteria bacterium]
AMLYHAYEVSHAMLLPVRQVSIACEAALNHPWSPASYVPGVEHARAACRVFNRITRRLGKPRFGVKRTTIDGLPVAVLKQAVMSLPFCDLRRFKREDRVCSGRNDPKVLIVAPMSGHYATLLRGTVKAMVPEHDVYLTDWRDARMVPLVLGRFDLDDYVDYIMRFMRFLGPDTHVIAVCQPSVPVLAATALMAAENDPNQPLSLTLMGGPIDPARNPTHVNEHAMSHDLSWFERHVISTVPFPHPGCMRRVYPGFAQLSGFLAMNLDRHIDAYRDYYLNLVKGDEESVQQHQDFYEEYMAVMDLSAEFFLQTVKSAFQERDLANGTMVHRGRRVDCSQIRRTALMTVEGERDDICGVGQTEAAHDICTALHDRQRHHYVQPGVGHYGVFNGTRWRTEIQPRIARMIRTVAAEQGVGKAKH